MSDEKKVVSLHGDLLPGEPNQSVISILEKCLEQAKSGNLTSIVLCGLCNNSETINAVEFNGPEILELLGNVEILKHRLVIMSMQNMFDAED